MKTYAYTKPELNLTITITPKAWAWAERRYSTPAVYADHQAAQFLAGRPVDNDVVIEWIVKPCATDSDRGGVAVAQAQPPVTVHPVINAAPVVESAPAETVWVTGRYQSGTRFWHAGFEYADLGFRAPVTLEVIHKYWKGVRDAAPAEASTWLRANGHASVADEIDAAEKYEPASTLPVVGDVVCSLSLNRSGTITRIEAGIAFCALGNFYSLCLFEVGRYRIIKRKGPTNG